MLPANPKTPSVKNESPEELSYQFCTSKVALVLDHTTILDECSIFDHPLWDEIALEPVLVTSVL